MERFNALGRGMQIMLVAGVLLLIDMFFAWQDFGLEIVEFSGWEGFAGVVLGLLTIVLVVWIALRLAAVDLHLPISQTMTTAVLGGLILVFAVIKLLSILGDEPTIWAFIGVILAVVIAFGAWQVVQAGGGVEKLKAEMPGMPSSSSDTAAAPAAPAAPPPPAPAEAAAPPETGAPAEAAGDSEESTDREA